jgi:hypothetical protein
MRRLHLAKSEVDAALVSGANSNTISIVHVQFGPAASSYLGFV